MNEDYSHLDKFVTGETDYLIENDKTLNEAVKLPPKIEDLRMGTLYVMLHSAVTKKSEKLPSGAPLLTQMLKSMSAVEKAMNKKGKAKGVEAYNAFVDAVKGHFTTGMAPMSTLIKKYKVPHNKMSGELEKIEENIKEAEHSYQMLNDPRGYKSELGGGI